MDIINDYIVFYKVIDAMEQKKKQNKAQGFKILNGRNVDYFQVAILK